MSFFSKIFLIFVLSFSLSSQIFAATGPEEIVELKEKVYYNVSPERPRLGDAVNIEAEMFGTDVKDTNFIWKIAGKVFREGVGANRIEFRLSEKTTVDLTIQTAGNITIEKSFQFDPKRIILVWESRTFTPPFYKGKSLYTSESTLILNAINLDQENPLTNTYNNYTWKVDNTVKGKDSGVGYSSFVYQTDLLGLEPLFKVSVAGITSLKDKTAKKGSTYEAEAILRVQKFPTQILSYEKSPLLGVAFNKTVKSEYNLNKSETTIVGYPLYYSLSTSLAGLYEWYINDVRVNSTLNEISFKKKNDNELSRLTLIIKNVNALLQAKNATYIVDTSN